MKTLMRGHRRTITIIGKRSAVRNRSPRSGWTVGCICGWVGGHQPNKALARAVYRVHLDSVIQTARRVCRRCGEEKPLADMASEHSRYVCRDCYSKRGNEWSRRHPEEARQHKRRHHLWKKFGLTQAAVAELLKIQAHKCGICCAPFSDSPGSYPHVDHDHHTGKVRGILCFRCNAGLGSFKDSVIRLRAAVAYLENHGAGMKRDEA